MRLMFFHKAAIVSLVLGLSAPMVKAENRGIVNYQLFFLFDPDSHEQVRRAQDLERAVDGVEGLRILGIVDSGDIGSRALDRLDFQILSVHDFLQQDQSVAEVVNDWLRSGNRSLLLVKETGAGTTTVAEDDFEGTVHRLSATPLTNTEVGVTTWGKVKDLFNIDRIGP